MDAGAHVDEETQDEDERFGPKIFPSIRSGPRPLFVTALFGQLAVAKLLLDAGADKAKKTPWGTAAEFARKNGHEELAQLLS